MATKRTRIIVNLPPHLGAIVQAHAKKERRSYSNFAGKIIVDWIAAQSDLVQEDQAPYDAQPAAQKRKNPINR